jgi:hypothetical protein
VLKRVSAESDRIEQGEVNAFEICNFVDGNFCHGGKYRGISPHRLGCSVAETQLFIDQRWVSTSFQPSLPRFYP